ncbi:MULTISPECIES: alpha/beta fold hydrolase [unclassified Ruegeria]|uniref:alpha/beta fold hydrolase n=1 Tax=unclassified Ruegeria TaxID=2625375 RepID=UPI0014911D93|nr:MULTISPECIES: alpha/beta hydrolase [unclassified Ruegeria]NOD87065.1 alpha/beta fold hydrolase [Ruegeria sp. HKCCD4318]NOE12620.1 alpha/beta fold hydrolase [Ruegeria sp. HKCCD4318-2]NOG09215.1 alpha/beta hydrolase [Ruegeria sp. HKCCD4315]
MELTPAPFFEDVAGGPAGGNAHWVMTSDQIRIRVGHWLPEGEAQGTVLMFPGRTEYIEKYGSTAAEFIQCGFAMLAVDWRGQGLADRLLDDPRVGHVDQFTDYQRDVQATLDLARTLDLPKPWFVIGHSMGGAIGLRAVIEQKCFAACAFTGPMWGIFFNPVMKPLSRVTAYWGTALGLGEKTPPTTTLESYVLSQPFEGNMLTRDPAMFRMMQDQLKAHPELALGAPSNLWLRESLDECVWLMEQPAPDTPGLTFLGSHEQIVDRKAIRARMKNWPNGTLVEIPDGEHEVLMEAPDVRGPVLDQLAAHFLSNRTS